MGLLSESLLGQLKRLGTLLWRYSPLSDSRVTSFVVSKRFGLLFRPVRSEQRGAEQNRDRNDEDRRRKDDRPAPRRRDLGLRRVRLLQLEQSPADEATVHGGRNDDNYDESQLGHQRIGVAVEVQQAF